MLFMKKSKNIIFFIIFSFFTSTFAYAKVGVGTENVKISGFGFPKKKVLQAIELAKPKACKDGFKKWIQDPINLTESERMIFESIQDQIYNNLNEYMSCREVKVPDLSKKEVKDKIKANQSVVVAMRAEVDKVRLLNEIKKSSKVFDSDTSEKSKLAMIFFSRTVSSQRQYDERVKNVEKSTSGIDINEEETETSISSETTTTNSTETGGSTLKKADVTEYIVDDNDTVKLEAGMKEIFTRARFEPVSGKRQVRKKWRELKSEIVDSLESGGAIPDEAKWDIEDILMEKGVSYVVFAYFDVGIPYTRSNGNQGVDVTLAIAEVARLGNSDPVYLGTISGIIGKGNGPTNDTAKAMGIKDVSKRTARELVSLINSKGIN